jgi:integrase
MSSAWIRRRETRAGKPRYQVEYRLGGRETAIRYAGSFKTHRAAVARASYIETELAELRVPDLGSLVTPTVALTLEQAGEAWRASRVDVSENTKLQHRSSVRIMPAALRARPVDTITAQDVADAVAALHAAGKKRETIRKAVTALAMVLDHAGITPNPARDKIIVKLPREQAEELNPPIADHVERVFATLPARHRLALVWLDWSGARVGSIDGLRVRDYDEANRRVRIPAVISKTRKALWVDLHPVLADAIEQAIGPREDRDPEALIFAGSGADALRTSIGKACRALGIPPWSPHDLRHRRVSLLHQQGKTWAEIGAFVGQRNLAVTSNIYTHVLMDTRGVNYAKLLDRVCA